MAAAVVVDTIKTDTKFADNTDKQESNAGQEPNAGADSTSTDRFENQESAVSTDQIENQENADARQVNAKANDKVNIENQESNAGLNAVAVRNLNAVQTDNATQENAASNAEQSGDSSTSAVQENVVDTKSMLSSNAVQESTVNTDVMQQLNAEQENNAKLMLEQNTDTAMQASAAVQVNAPVREDNAEQQLVEGESKEIPKRPLPPGHGDANGSGQGTPHRRRSGSSVPPEGATQEGLDRAMREERTGAHLPKEARCRVMRDAELHGVEEAFRAWPLAREESDDEQFNRLYPKGWKGKEEREVHGKYLDLYRDQERRRGELYPGVPPQGVGSVEKTRWQAWVMRHEQREAKGVVAGGWKADADLSWKKNLVLDQLEREPKPKS